MVSWQIVSSTIANKETKKHASCLKTQWKLSHSVKLCLHDKHKASMTRAQCKACPIKMTFSKLASKDILQYETTA